MQSPLTDEEFGNVTRPIETALGLPNRAYTDDAFLDAERERVLGRGWIAVAFSRDVLAPGDLFPASAAGQPLLVVRDANRSIRVFHNVCRHRGTRLVDGPCKARKRITCPYHGWTYGLDGALLATPNFSGPGDHSHSSLDDGEHATRGRTSTSSRSCRRGAGRAATTAGGSRPFTRPRRTGFRR